MATACRDISRLIAAGPFAAPAADLARAAHMDLGHGDIVGENAGGDQQKALDLRAHDIVVDALRTAPVAMVGSEEADAPIPLASGAPVSVAVDPLDGSSNIDVNMSIGTIFSVLPHRSWMPHDASEAALLQPGHRQLAAGYATYGPMTELVLTLGRGTHVFILDEAGAFRLTGANVTIAPQTGEFAINASNYRHWDAPVRAYIDDCLSGAEGMRGRDFNMRWIGSLVAEASRILTRGGVFLYPGDQRDGYAEGRLRLVYEANPIAFLVEQAGGAASTGTGRILDLVPGELHQRVPLIFGSRDEVERVENYTSDPHSLGERSPLFGRRGLFRA
ncbi:class 1 fructose-bisphosphatase [Breoghania sp. L-A4]|uniref:class 1 fructose-bisphosphatase n=1 Tax=Breoghania sp. L-A4 TaxID=2304600 RepID=UPI0020BFF20F|nr:class 1 fructose-bisphosphatase [Breoghania sp. L-A4]